MSKTKIKENPELYSCWTIAKEYGGHTNVVLSLMHGGPQRGGGVVIPYNQVIKDYYKITKNDRIYPESRIDELFLWSEVEALKEYLAKYYNSELEYSKEELPIDNNIAGFSCQAFGGGLDMGPLKQDDRIYTLDFSVWFGYDLRHCECPNCLERQRLYRESREAFLAKKDTAIKELTDDDFNEEPSSCTGAIDDLPF